MKKLIAFAMLFYVHCLFSQSFIDNLKPILWQKSNFKNFETNTLNDYGKIENLEAFKIKSKALTVFFVSKCELKQLNDLIVKKNQTIKVIEQPQANIQNGVLYATFLNSSKKSSYNFRFDNKDMSFYEIIIFDKILNEEDKLKIETLLSLKYGVSLAKTVNYINSEKDILWDNKLLNKYNENVIGVGHFKKLDFVQLKSENSEDNSLEIIFKPENLSTEKYVLFGGNNNENEKIWYIKKENINKNDKIELKFKALSDDLYLVLSTDENFIDNVRYLPLIKKDNEYTSDLISVENYQYFKLQELKQQVLETNIVSSFDNQWVVYPNPSFGKFYLDFNFNKQTEVTYIIHDALGKIISQKRIGIIDKHTQTVEENLTTGVYFIHIKTNNETSIKKLIIK